MMAIHADELAKTMHVDQLSRTFSSDEWPQFLALQREGDRCVITLYLNRKIRWFEGHFPSQPVLAGVVQTHWAGRIGRALFPLQTHFLRIDNLKFQSVILPEQEVNLTLTCSADASSLRFQYAHEGTSFSEGKLVFEDR